MAERPFDDLSAEETNYTILLRIENTDRLLDGRNCAYRTRRFLAKPNAKLLSVSKCKLKIRQGNVPIEEEPASDIQR